MTYLTQKKVLFEWDIWCEKSFQKLKTMLTSAPVLTLPIKDKDFIVFCDAPHLGLGIVLMQDRNMIAYLSIQLNFNEKNYPTHDLGLEVVVFTLKFWRHYLYGVNFEVFTYHCSLQYVCIEKELNLRQRT